MPRIRIAVGVACVWLLVAASSRVPGAPGPAASAAPAGSAAAGAFAPMSDLIGFGSSGESFGEYPRTFPRLKELGVHWVRMFPEWAAVQPRQGEWDWRASDSLVATGRENGIKTLGVFCYFAPWSSSRSGDTRAFPVRDMQFWRDYVKRCVARYRADIDAWEVWNEPNSGAFNKGGSVKDYADLVREAYGAAKEVEPKIKIGITCASFDVNYLDQVMGQGAAGCFDFVAVHPYNSIDFLFGYEASYLGMAANLRKLIEKHKMPEATEMWITEIGLTTPNTAAENARQAEALAKAFILSAAQGFRKVFWFEARGPRYGTGDFSILSSDYSLRPSGQATGALAHTLGARRYAGWLNPEGRSYGFLFDGEGGPVLAVWAPPKMDVKLRLPSEVTTVDMAGKETVVPAQQDILLTTMPLLVKAPPADLVQAARSQCAKPFPWGTDYAKEREAWCRLAVANTDHGLMQKPWGDGATTTGLVDGDEYRSTAKAKRSPYMYFDVDNTFAAFGDNDLDVTVVARCSPGNKGSLRLCYESLTGYHETPGAWTVPGDDKWYEHTFHVTDANFADTWGWNFRIDVAGSPADVWVKEVKVKRNALKK
jgi:hypothetical protein